MVRAGVNDYIDDNNREVFMDFLSKVIERDQQSDEDRKSGNNWKKLDVPYEREWEIGE